MSIIKQLGKPLLRFLMIFLTIDAIIIGLTAWRHNWSAQIDIFLVIIICSIIAFISGLLCSIFYVIYKTQRRKLPKVIMGTIQCLGDNEYPLCIIEKSEFYSINALVALYYKEDEHEKFISLGYVQNIQEDGNIQVLLRSQDDNTIIQGIKESRKQIIEKIIVKPHIPRQYSDLGGYYGRR